MSRCKYANLAYWNSGAGIARDVGIVEELLQQEGFKTRHIPSKYFQSNLQRRMVFLRQWHTLLRPVAFQFHFQWIQREQCLHGKKNFMFVNPEFTDARVFPRIKQHIAVLCKTRIAESLFSQEAVESHYVGFTSDDRSLKGCQKDFRKFLHVAGLSDYKGTDVLVEAWRRNPDWPTLTIIRAAKDREGNLRKKIEPARNIRVINEWIPDEALKRIQNEHGVHLCPSEMEGFGHYILEGMSTGAFMVTTDAAPMNEFVDESNGLLIRARKMEKSYMSDRWKVDRESLEAGIHQILAMERAEIMKKATINRKKFEEINKSFRENFRNFIRAQV